MEHAVKNKLISRRAKWLNRMADDVGHNHTKPRPIWRHWHFYCTISSKMDSIKWFLRMHQLKLSNRNPTNMTARCRFGGRHWQRGNINCKFQMKFKPSEKRNDRCRVYTSGEHNHSINIWKKIGRRILCSANGNIKPGKYCCPLELALKSNLNEKRLSKRPKIGGKIKSAEVPLDDELLEIFQFGTFHIVGNKFCLVNRRWSLLAQWHIQNRKRRIPGLFLFVRELCLPLIGPTISWQKRGYLCSSAGHDESSLPIDGDIPLEIPKNIEQIRSLHINLPFDREHVHGQKFIAFIAACSKHMRKCRIHISWNGIVPPLYVYIMATSFMPLFRASISQLDELHMVLEVNIGTNKIWAISHDVQKWLLCRPLDGGNFGNNNYSNKEEGNFMENKGDGRRKLVLINITFFYANQIMVAIKKEFLSSRMLSIPTFSAKFILSPPTPFQQIPQLEPIKVKNTLTGQVFMWAYSEPAYGDMSTILMRCCDSEAESNKQAEFTQTSELNNIIWNLRPGKLYKSPEEIRAAEEEKEKKLPPDFVDLLLA